MFQGKPSSMLGNNVFPLCSIFFFFLCYLYFNSFSFFYQVWHEDFFSNYLQLKESFKMVSEFFWRALLCVFVSSFLFGSCFFLAFLFKWGICSFFFFTKSLYLHLSENLAIFLVSTVPITIICGVYRSSHYCFKR